MSKCFPDIFAGQLPSNPASYGQYYSWRVVTLASDGSLNRRILDNNGQRVAILFGRVGSAPIGFSPVRVSTYQESAFELTSGSLFSINFSDFGSLVQSEWFVNTSVASGQATLTEVVYTPRPCNPVQRLSQGLAER